MQFLSKEHEKRFGTLMAVAEASYGDTERMALLFILAGNDELHGKAKRIYDFKKQQLATGRSKLVLSSSGVRLMNLGISLYGASKKADVYDTFSRLDSKNTKLALNAIMLRFGQR